MLPHMHEWYQRNILLQILEMIIYKPSLVLGSQYHTITKLSC